MFPFRPWRATSMPGLPQSLRSQFRLGLAALSLMIVAVGMAAVLALRNTDGATQRLAEQQLLHLQQAQAIMQRTSREQLTPAADALLVAAVQHAEAGDRSYRNALGELVEYSQGNQRGILLVLGIALLFTWMVAGLFLNRYLLQRLERVSSRLLQGHSPPAPTVDGEDEIADMALAVDRLLADRAQLEHRTAELGFAKDMLTEQGRILEEIAARAALPEVLARLVRFAESQLDGITGSILLLDDDGVHLRHGAAPGLPEGYNRLIDGVAIGPGVGSCGTAVHRREPVIVCDIQQDPLWQDYRGLAAEHGLRSCWSTPILAHDGAVLGSFAMYSGRVRAPEPRELRVVEMAVRIAGIALERRRSEQRIQHMAHHDELTGLPNRALLNDRMTQALAHARRSGRTLALLFLDLDGFKYINDSLGHAVGDRLLQAVAARLQAMVRAGDTVARLGGDEFVVMLVDLDRPEHAASVARDIGRVLAQAFHTADQTLHVTASIGVSGFPADGDSAGALLAHADAAMYRAKAQGRNGFQCYTREMGLQAQQRAELHSALREAVDRGQFELHYQPQIELATGRIAAVEALIRWPHPTLGLVSPDRFIPLAEETGLIAPIGEWVLREACRQLQAWRAAGHTRLEMAVNLSARQFDAHDIPRLVLDALQAAELPASCLELELTETALMHNAEAVHATLQALKEIGVDLALDDFGTGYSSLSHLRRFPIDTIKIDKSFTAEITTSADTTTIIRAIVAMAGSLGVQTVAEGVENDEQLRFLAGLDCHRVQGYHLGRPLPAGQTGALLAQHRGRERVHARLAAPRLALNVEAKRPITR